MPENSNPQTKNETLLEGLKIAALVENYFEQVELTTPREAFEAAGAEVDIVARQRQLTGLNHTEMADNFTTDIELADARPEDFDALLLPGGVINSDALRILPEAQRFVKAMVQQNKPVAVICHGGWILISCGLVRGHTFTSWPTLQDDYRNAGAQWVDRECVLDGQFVSSRKPDDLPAFTRQAIELFAGQLRQRPKAA